jgi:hypothetical protein
MDRSLTGSSAQPSHLGMTRRQPPTQPAAHHGVPCPCCGIEFDLFAAPWCTHWEGVPSKVCPECERCACEHPAYSEPHFWKEAPRIFQAHGFDRLFLLYL